VAEGAVSVDLLYLDHEGGQRTVSRFSFIRREVHPGEPGDVASSGDEDDEDLGAISESRYQWWVSLSLHHTLDAS
jgi:hypothetical protein